MVELLFVVALAASGPLPAFAVETHQFNVPAEEAPDAVRDFASQAQVQILVAGENVKDKHLHAVSGTFSTDQGLRLLLADSGLAPQYIGERSIALVSSSDTTSTQEKAKGNRGVKEGKQSIADGIRMAQMDRGSAAGVGSVSVLQSTSGEPVQLEEVVVTARKREERLQDVPVPVTVLNAQSLASTGQILLSDYYSRVPGLSFNPDLQGSQNLIIRGITTAGGTNPTVAVAIDDVPFGGSTGLGTLVPDIDPGDLARIEVLRGPQGPLYGANSMGGLVKYVTIDPSTDSLTGRIEVGAYGVKNGDEPGYNVRGSVNIPISQTFALRASGFRRQDAGYIDNPVLDIKGINEAKSDGGRLAALWRPSDTFSIKLSALYQDTRANGASQVEPSVGDLQQNYLRGTGGYQQTVQAYSATVNAKLGLSDFTSITGYNINEYRDSFDYTSYRGAFTSKVFGVSVSGTPAYDYDTVRKVSQELRLDTPLGEHVDWLLGAFYTHEDGPSHEILYGEDPSNGQLVGQLAYINRHAKYEEFAGFTALTYRITDRFDVQIGGRETHIRVTTDTQTQSGPLYGPTPRVTPGGESTANAFTYLLTPRLRISPELMLYARLASGYRPGGPNSPSSVLDGAPSGFNPDKTRNYELGVKGDFIDHRIVVDMSAYYIDWSDIQIQFNTPRNFAYTANGSGAKSEGVEFSLTTRPLTGLTASAWVSYDDAVLTDAFPLPPAGPVYGVPGSRLPDSSRFSGNVSLEQQFPLWNQATGFLGATETYVGDRIGLFTSTPTRQRFPPYAKTDLRAGFRQDGWEATLYVDNLMDRRGLINTVAFFPNEYIYIRPRMIGVDVVKTF